MDEQKLNEVADQASNSRFDLKGKFQLGCIYEQGFIAGAYWHERQNPWRKVEDEKPISYETGNWDGKRSDFVLVKNNKWNWYKARIYQEFMDGSLFCDWFDEDDGSFNNIVEWKYID